MKVILLERVEGTGVLGDVVTVKDGFARNFLLPRAKALRANSANLKTFEAQRAEIEARNVKNRETAGKSGEGLDGKQYVMIRQAGESGQLYGSVAGRDVADAIKAEGGKVDRSMIVLDKPIKTLGVHEVKVKLHAEVTVTVTLNIARSARRSRASSARRKRDRRSVRRRPRTIEAEAASDMAEGGAGSFEGDHYEA
jgi:large subunit ribosomal protein L9